MKAIVLVLTVIGLLSAVSAEAKPFKFLKRGSMRSQAQHVVNAAHPTGQSRAAAEHAVNAAVPNGSGKCGKIPPGQLKKMSRGK